MAEYQQTKVDIQNLQVITFQIRYRSSKSVKAKLQKWTFYGVDLDPQTTFSDFFCHFQPLNDRISTNQVDILNLPAITFQTRY